MTVVEIQELVCTVLILRQPQVVSYLVFGQIDFVSSPSTSHLSLDNFKVVKMFLFTNLLPQTLIQNLLLHILALLPRLLAFLLILDMSISICFNLLFFFGNLLGLCILK